MMSLLSVSVHTTVCRSSAVSLGIRRGPFHNRVHKVTVASAGMNVIVLRWLERGFRVDIVHHNKVNRWHCCEISHETANTFYCIDTKTISSICGDLWTNCCWVLGRCALFNVLQLLQWCFVRGSNTRRLMSPNKVCYIHVIFITGTNHQLRDT